MASEPEAVAIALVLTKSISREALAPAHVPRGATLIGMGAVACAVLVGAGFIVGSRSASDWRSSPASVVQAVAAPPAASAPPPQPPIPPPAWSRPLRSRRRPAPRAVRRRPSPHRPPGHLRRRGGGKPSVDCSVPYSVDANGNRHYTPECVESRNPGPPRHDALRCVVGLARRRRPHEDGMHCRVRSGRQVPLERALASGPHGAFRLHGQRVPVSRSSRLRRRSSCRLKGAQLTIVFKATDRSGRDLSDVSVDATEERLVPSLDGRAIPVDLETLLDLPVPRSSLVTMEVVVGEGEMLDRDRRAFGPGASEAPLAPAPSSTHARSTLGWAVPGGLLTVAASSASGDCRRASAQPWQRSRLSPRELRPRVLHGGSGTGCRPSSSTPTSSSAWAPPPSRSPSSPGSPSPRRAPSPSPPRVSTTAIVRITPGAPGKVRDAIGAIGVRSIDVAQTRWTEGGNVANSSMK